MPKDGNIPAADDEFHKLQGKLVGAVAADPAKFGCTDQDKNAATSTQADWDKKYAVYLVAKEAFEKATEAKDAAREAHEPNVRGLINKINVTPSMTNEIRLDAGLPARDASGRRIIGAPVTVPIGRIEVAGRLSLVLHFVDEKTPLKLAKPEGVHGCEIHHAIGSAEPASPTGYTFLALDTRTPYTHDFDGADAGKNVYYLLRWQNTKGQAGPWSEVITAKIPS
jgi:hypothetical protein